MIVIGYQGVEGSNSERAAAEFALKKEFTDFTLLPLVSSFNVLDNVIKKRVDYGVVAAKNSSGGVVKETKIVLDHLDLKKKDEITIPIHHYLFVKNESITINDIDTFVSHPQAFKQCINTLKNDYQNISLVDDEDTATAARKLSLGILDKNCGVLCRKNAGESNNLHLLKSNLEDRTDNKTTFYVY
jgi:prephenate dehydratase